jgi:hypothetical protein
LIARICIASVGTIKQRGHDAAVCAAGGADGRGDGDRRSGGRGRGGRPRRDSAGLHRGVQPAGGPPTPAPQLPSPRPCHLPVRPSSPLHLLPEPRF